MDTFECDSFSITWLKNNLAEEEFLVELEGNIRNERYFLRPGNMYCSHFGHLKRINHNEWLIVNIGFVISVVMMGRFLNTIRRNKILREMACDLRFPFKVGLLIQVKRTKKDKHGTAKVLPRPLKRWPLATGNNYSVCIGENSRL